MSLCRANYFVNKTKKGEWKNGISAGLSKGFLQRHGGSMPCVVVKNMGRGLDFGPADQSIAQVQLPPGSELFVIFTMGGTPFVAPVAEEGVVPATLEIDHGQ